MRTLCIEPNQAYGYTLNLWLRKKAAVVKAGHRIDIDSCCIRIYWEVFSTYSRQLRVCVCSSTAAVLGLLACSAGCCHRSDDCGAALRRPADSRVVAAVRHLSDIRAQFLRLRRRRRRRHSRWRQRRFTCITTEGATRHLSGDVFIWALTLRHPCAWGHSI